MLEEAVFGEYGEITNGALRTLFRTPTKVGVVPGGLVLIGKAAVLKTAG